MFGGEVFSEDEVGKIVLVYPPCLTGYHSLASSFYPRVIFNWNEEEEILHFSLYLLPNLIQNIEWFSSWDLTENYIQLRADRARGSY